MAAGSSSATEYPVEARRLGLNGQKEPQMEVLASRDGFSSPIRAVEPPPSLPPSRPPSRQPLCEGEAATVSRMTMINSGGPVPAFQKHNPRRRDPNQSHSGCQKRARRHSGHECSAFGWRDSSRRGCSWFHSPGRLHMIPYPFIALHSCDNNAVTLLCMRRASQPLWPSDVSLAFPVMRNGLEEWGVELIISIQIHWVWAPPESGGSQRGYRWRRGWKEGGGDDFICEESLNSWYFFFYLSLQTLTLSRFFVSTQS